MYHMVVGKSWSPQGKRMIPYIWPALQLFWFWKVELEWTVSISSSVNGLCFTQCEFQKNKTKIL